jgi:hypothetical protein
MGATGIEPMTSTVSRDAGWSILFIRLGSLCSILVHFARYSALIVPKLFPSVFARRSCHKRQKVPDSGHGEARNRHQQIKS